MKAYIGFDLGTTNTKALVLSAEGSILDVMQEKTSTIKIAGVEYVDLPVVEEKVEAMFQALKKKYSIAGIAFTSIGESVVPIKDGKPLCRPLMWHETVTSELFEAVREEIGGLAGYNTAGLTNDFRLSLYKILWMQKNSALEDVDFWLPISSYLVYKYTGTVVWAESQACRSYLYNIHDRQWNAKVLEYAGLQDKLGTLAYTGKSVGQTKDGITVGVAGHDHITGLYGVYTLSGNADIFYDSMGTSSVLGAVVKEKNNELRLERPFFNGKTGVIGAAYQDGQYYIQNSFRYFGILLEKLSLLTGGDAGGAYYDQLNRQIALLPNALPKTVFSVGGDCIAGAKKQLVNILNFPIDLTPVELMQSAYIYLSAMSRLILDGVSQFCDVGSPFYAGGRIVRDEVFMRYKASMIQKEIIVFDTEELTALGAAIAAITAAGDVEALRACRAELRRRTIAPDERLIKDLDAGYDIYCNLKQSSALDYFQ